MPTLQKFFANITSRRDNGSPIELNLRWTHCHERGTMENSFESYSEYRITQCQVINERAGTNKVWCTTVEFYEFSTDEQERFLEAAIQNMEADD